MRINKQKLVNIQDVSELSLYGRYWVSFLHYNFKNNVTNKIYTKGQFWDSFKPIAIKMLKDDEYVHPEFDLITFEESQYEDYFN